MAYTPREIKDRVAVGDDIFLVEDLGNNRIRLIPTPTHVSEAGTPVNKALLQPMENHMGNVANPHETTKAQVGLGNVDNIKQATKVEFDAHKGDVANPHATTKAQVGLGNVPNYGVASASEARSGTSNSLLMTPARTKDAILGISRWARGSRFVVGKASAGYTATDVDFLCDGTNDADVINYALSSIPSSGGEVVLLDGSYLLYNEIVVPNGATLSGSGEGTNIMGHSTSLPNLIRVEGILARLRSLRLMSNGVTVLGDGVTLEDLSIYNTWVGVSVEGDMCSIVNSRFLLTSTGVVVHSDNCIISHNLFDSATSGEFSTGVFVQGGWTIVTNNIIVTDPTASTRRSVILVNSSEKCLVSGNLLHGVPVSNNGTNNNVVNNVV